MAHAQKTRRDILKKAGGAAFIIPAAMSFNIRELQAAASQPYSVSQITCHFNTPDSSITPFFGDRNNVDAVYNLELKNQRHLIEMLGEFAKEQHETYLAIIRKVL